VAFPTVEDADTQNGTVTSNSTSWTLTYPTNLASGDLIVAALGTDGNTLFTGVTFPAGFEKFRMASGTACNLLVGLKISDGTETGTFQVTLNSEQGGWRVFRITGWFGSGLPTGNNVTSAVNGTGAALVGSSGASSTPDPASLNPTDWDVEDTLWFALMAADTSRTVSAFPTTWTDTFSDVSGGAGGATLAGARIENNVVAAVDPGTFTISASDDWACITLAIRPAAPVATDPVNRHMSPLMHGVPNF
jgi:hypothetical protein